MTSLICTYTQFNNAHLNELLRAYLKLFHDFCFDDSNDMAEYLEWMEEGGKQKKNLSEKSGIFNWWMMNKCMRLFECSLCGIMKCMGNLNFRIQNDSNMHILQNKFPKPHSYFWLFYLLCTPFRWTILIIATICIMQRRERSLPLHKNGIIFFSKK